MTQYYLTGKYAALDKLALLDRERLTPATGDAGRVRGRSNDDPEDTARTAFMNHDQQMNTPGAQSSQLSVGSGQSKRAAAASGYPLQGRMDFQGLKISIEQRKGAVRKWKDDSTGEEGSSKMLHPYGYIRMTEGADGDHVDVYVGPNENATHAYIINQMKKPKKPTKGKWTQFDEQKVMLGFRNAQEAKNAYLGQYNDPRFFGSMTVMSMDEFKKKVLDKKNWGKKLASNLSELDRQLPVRTELTNTFDVLPSQHLGVLGKYRNGNDSLPGGWEATSEDTIDRAFNHVDNNMDTTAVEGNSSATPASPGV